eukprot:jgi/Mesvir1/20783/Mv07894-RA.1
MVLEATIVCVDNSEWTRNGDYPPSRFQAQSDAVNLLCGAKTQDNPENTVGVLTLAGKSVRVLLTPTTDLGKVLGCMHTVEVEGQADLLAGVQVAQLALKHRQNKNQRQRIVLFVGSPVTADVNALVRVAKKLKKNNVAVDIINFAGDDDETSNTEKLEAFLAAVNSGDNSHLVNVPSGPHNLSDALVGSPVFMGEGGAAGGFAGVGGLGVAGDGGYEFGVDPNVDPELALALRVSMEEEKARQAAAEEKARAAAAAAAAGAGPSGAGDDKAADASAGGATAGGEGVRDGSTAAGGAMDSAEPMLEDDEDALLQKALAMSMAESVAPASQAKGGAKAGEDVAMGDPGQAAAGADINQILGDPAFLNSVIASLPGVDPNDPSVRGMLESLGVGGAPPQGGVGDKKEEKGDSKDKESH